MRGNYAEAESTLNLVLELQRDRADVDPLAHARLLDDLASVLVMAEQVARAIPLLEEALAILEVRLEAGDFALSSVLSDLGVAYQSVGRYEDAESALLRAQRMEELRNGPDHVYTQLAGQNLGAFYRETGRLDKDVLYYEPS